jgi:hypothetical protein
MTYQSGAGAGRSEWLLNTVKQNPEGLLLLAAGAVLLLRKSSSASARSVSRAYSQSNSQYPQPAGASVGDTMRESAAGFADQAKEAVSSFASSASGYAGEARRAVGEQSERIVRSTQSTLQSSMDRVLQDQPLLIAAAGLAAGVAVAAAFPATAMEKQALGPIGDQISEAAGRVGEQLQQATAKAGEKLKSAADERGLNTDGLKEVATEVASAFGDTMSGKKDQPSTRAGKKDQPSTSGFDTPTFKQYTPEQGR